MEERKCPTCIGLAMFGPPKSTMTRLPFPLSGSALVGLRVERLQPLFERLGRELDVDEARPRDHRLADQRRFAQARGDLLGDRARVGFRELRRRQSAVALEFGEVRAVGDLHLPQLGRNALRRERGSRDRRELGEK